MTHGDSVQFVHHLAYIKCMHCLVCKSQCKWFVFIQSLSTLIGSRNLTGINTLPVFLHCLHSTSTVCLHFVFQLHCIYVLLFLCTMCITACIMTGNSWLISNHGSFSNSCQYIQVRSPHSVLRRHQRWTMNETSHLLDKLYAVHRM